MQGLFSWYFLLRPSALGHDAIIEIMIALLGIMLTVLALGVAVLGWFGYIGLREEAVKWAVKEARKTAKSTASAVAKREIKHIWDQEQAAGMTGAQAEAGEPVGTVRGNAVVQKSRSSRRRATSDRSLREEGEK